jgi:hypothetical protein
MNWPSGVWAGQLATRSSTALTAAPGGAARAGRAGRGKRGGRLGPAVADIGQHAHPELGALTVGVS